MSCPWAGSIEQLRRLRLKGQVFRITWQPGSALKQQTVSFKHRHHWRPLVEVEDAGRAKNYGHQSPQRAGRYSILE